MNRYQRRSDSDPVHVFDHLGGGVDEHGNPVKRTKMSHPYSYDGFVLWRGGPNEAANNTVYSDRMEQWDYEKARRCLREQMPGLRFDNAPAEKIEAYLRAYFDDPKLRLILVMEYCNQSSGYPVWRFDFYTRKFK